MTNKIILTNNFKNSSILQLGDTYYMPKPSYENFPMIPIFTSSDKLNWELTTHAIHESNKFNFSGVESAGGVWSPSLSHDGKKFYLVFSLVKSFGGNNLNLDNYAMYSTDIDRKWSEPVYLNSNKASSILIHDESKSYLISLRLNIESEYEATRCIVMQEFDRKKSTLVGEETIIAKPVARGELFSEICFEQVEGIYQLTLVEYTKNKKKATVLSSPELVSMYHVLKFVDDVVEEPKSTVIEDTLPVEKKSQAETETSELVEKIEPPIVEPEPTPQPQVKYNDTKKIGVYTLRESLDDSWYKKGKTKEDLIHSLRGRSTLSSKFEQSFMGLPVLSENIAFQTKLNFKPENIYQSAGIACYYSTEDYFYLRLYKSEVFGGLTIGITSAINGEKFEILHHGIKLGDMIENVHLKLTKNNNILQFSYSLFSGSSWVNVSTPIDVGSIENKHDGTCLVGITASDQNNKSAIADFYGMQLV